MNNLSIIFLTAICVFIPVRGAYADTQQDFYCSVAPDGNTLLGCWKAKSSCYTSIHDGEQCKAEPGFMWQYMAPDLLH